LPKPVVLFEDRAIGALVRGFDELAELLAVTLGPSQGFVLNQREHQAPELVEDSASAARRVIETPGRARTVGAMMLRNTAWRVHTRAGDGVATAAVLAQAMLRDATRYVRSGGDPVLVKRGVEGALGVALEALVDQSQPATGEEHLSRLAQTMTGDPDMSLLLGEMLDVLGPGAHITVEDYEAPYLERTYQDGGNWRAAIASPYLLTDVAGRRAVLEDCHVALCAGTVDSADDVAPLLALVAQHKGRLLLVAHDVSGKGLNTLLTNHDRKIVKAVAVWLRRGGEDRANDFRDLAVITGAAVLGPEQGRPLANIQETDLGGVHRVEASADQLSIRGGAGDPAQRRSFVDGLRLALSESAGSDHDRNQLRLRLANLAGGVGVLKVGAHTRSERESMHQRAEKAIRALRLALEDGVVPGGGAAYLGAVEAVNAYAGSLGGDRRQGALILARALEEPCRRIVRNRAAVVPAAVLAELRRRGPGFAYDVLDDRFEPASESGLEDPTGVLRVALETAVSGAMSALSVAVMVLRRRPSKDVGAYA
jgi:chaperonin GroEL